MYQILQVLKQRSKRDAQARHVYNYYKYVRDYHLLPPCANDHNEQLTGVQLRQQLHDTFINNRDRIKRMFKNR
jgi:hypothetical protein